VSESGVQPHILVVDDARDIREPLVRYLRESGYRASAADGAQAARRLMRTSAIDLVILDIMMPGEDGLSLCRSIRENSGIPVIMLTARGDELDRIVGLEVGADDYVSKPFNPRELLARVGAVLRRTNTLPPRLRGPTAERYRFGEWTFNAAQREIVGPEGLALPLSSGEYKLLMAFLERPKVALSREQLLDLTKGRDAEVLIARSTIRSAGFGGRSKSIRRTRATSRPFGAAVICLPPMWRFSDADIPDAEIAIRRGGRGRGDFVESFRCGDSGNRPRGRSANRAHHGGC
jgi:two-component system OmpR family response regulator